jgi:hypothetical protein
MIQHTKYGIFVNSQRMSANHIIHTMAWRGNDIAHFVCVNDYSDRAYANFKHHKGSLLRYPSAHHCPSIFDMSYVCIW